MTEAKKNRIDVHHHLVPPEFLESAHRHGLTKVAGARLPDWTPQRSIDVMDRYDIQTAMLSLSAPGVYFGDRKEARDLARACNEFAAETREKHPGRFGSFAVLPMPFTQDACEEAIYALDVLDADGVVLLGSTDGIFLGDSRFDELMAELDRRSAIVFVHPNIHPTSEQLPLDIPDFLIEFLCDTTRAATNLIFKGTVERYSRIKFILAHAGGFLPYVAWRLSLANEMPTVARHAPRGVLHYVRNFYFDTALSPSPYAMAALKELVDPTHILFGSDFPFAPEPAVGMEIKTLDALTVLEPATLADVDRENALRLFPRYAGATGATADPSLGARLKSAIAEPIMAAADVIRRR